MMDEKCLECPHCHISEDGYYLFCDYIEKDKKCLYEEGNRMTNAEAKAKIKSLIMAEIDRIPSHYDAEIEEEVYSNTAEVNELLELNKIVCGALEKQIPKKPIDNTEQEWFECPICGRVVVTYHNGKRHHCRCGQAIDFGEE